ncbi:MAG: hypothetical protein FWH23_05510 [Bacteroidales bacterium]|nr:hypothetical protein [Bacteroidales bacterium]MCL2132895.1 hypothetical protein [Bacteroidales bacterium]
MKKILFFTVLAFISLHSCIQKEYITEYYENPNGLTMDTYYITVYPIVWQTANDGYNFYRYASINLPAINGYGIVLAYFIDGDYDNILPYVRSYNSGDIEIIRFDIEERYITFIIENHENELPIIPTTNWQFKVVIIQ